MAIAFVDSGSGSNSAFSTTLALSSINLATGNAVVAATKWETAGDLSSITDTAGNTYSLLTLQSYASGSAGIRGGYALNCASHATNVVTFTYNVSADWRQGGCCQYSGVSATGFDQQGHSSGNSTTPASGNVTTTQADEVGVGWTGGFTSETYSNRTINGSAANARVTGSDFALWDLIVSSTFTGNAACTQSVSNQWGCSIATFKEAVAGGHPAMRRLARRPIGPKGVLVN